MQQYGEVVHAVAPARFETRRNAVLAERAAAAVDELDTDELVQMAKAFGDEFEAATGERFPTDPHAQLNPTFPTGALILEFCRQKLNLFKGR